MAGTALVTGSRGFTGSHMVEVLAEAGWGVVATDLAPERRPDYYVTSDDTPHPVYHPDLPVETNDNVTFVAADLTDTETLDPLFEEHDIDVVFHIASMFDYFASKETLYAVNVEGGRNIAKRALEHDVDHFIHWSTLGVLGGAGFDEPKDESAPYRPHNEYCESKVAQEKVMLELEEEGLPLTILRPAPIYGPRHAYGVYHIPRILSKLGFAFVIRIYPRRKQLMFPCIHVKDLVEMALFVEDNREETVGEIYNAASDPIPQDVCIEFIADLVNVRTKRVPLPYPLYRVLAAYNRIHARYLQKKARKKGVRPKIDAPITNYLTHNMWFDNQKIKDSGFEFEYSDPRQGLLGYVSWGKSRGWFQ